jgi:uncharacterized protein YcfL
MRTSLVTILAAFALAGCHGSDNSPVGGVSPDEAAALNNAAEVMDASPDSLGVNAEDESAIPADASTNPDGAGLGNAQQLGASQADNSNSN